MILYFSGTGNTAFAANLLAKELDDDSLIPISGDLLINPENHNLSLQGKRVCWAFPIYSWGVPPVLVNFIRKVRLDSSMSSVSHFMLATCGDDVGYADRMWRSELRRRGLNPTTAFSVEMPNTYVCMKGFDVDSSLLEQKKLSDAPASIRKIAHSILHESGDMLTRLSFSWIKTFVIYPWFKRFAMSAKPFHALDSCISCGKCAASCPMQNIEMTVSSPNNSEFRNLDSSKSCSLKPNSHTLNMSKQRPKWSDNCAMCLRCYHICPVHAVAYGKETLTKGQYRTLISRLFT